MKNILIITYNMIPYTHALGSCQRMYFFAEYLLKKRFDVSVISCADKFIEKRDFGYKINFKHYAITTNRVLKFLEIIYHHIKKRKLIPFRFAFLSELDLYTGFGGITWLVSAKKKIKTIINENKIDTVIISGPPFTLFKVVNFLKKYKCQIVLDYRDSWFDWSKNSYLRKKEKRILNQVDQIMVFSELFMNDLTKEYGLNESKCFTVYNGFNSTLWHNFFLETSKNLPAELNRKYILITLTGSYSLTDHEPTSIKMFLEALAKYEHKDLFRITIVGLKRDGYNLWENRLEKIIKFTGVLEHNEAIKMLFQSDILLMSYPYNDEFTSRYMIMGKFMDYIKSKKPIWGIYRHPSEFSSMINKHGLGITCTNNEIEIKKCFDLLVDLKVKDNMSILRNKDFDKEYFYDRNFQYNHFIENCS